MNRIKKFAKDNKKPLLEIAGFAVIELCAIGAYTMACNHYGYKMVRPYVDENGRWFAKGITGKTFYFVKEQ